MAEFHDNLRKFQLEFRDKQESYDEKVAKAILTSLQVPHYLVRSNGGISLRNVNETFLESRNIAVESKKLSKPLDLNQFFSNKLEKSEYLRAYNDLRQNWPTVENFVLIFDKHADGIGDLAVFNSQVLVNDAHPVFKLMDNNVYRYIQTAKAFYERFGSLYAHQIQDQQ